MIIWPQEQISVKFDAKFDNFSFKEIGWNMSFAKWHPFFLSFNVFTGRQCLRLLWLDQIRLDSQACDTKPWYLHPFSIKEKIRCLLLWKYLQYHQTSNIRRTLDNKIVDHLDVVGALPVGAAPTTSSFSTLHLVSMDCAETTARRDEKHLSLWIWCNLY